MKQEAPPPRTSRAGIPGLQSGVHVKEAGSVGRGGGCSGGDRASVEKVVAAELFLNGGADAADRAAAALSYGGRG